MNVNKRVVILRSNSVNPDSRVEKESLALVKAGYRVKILCWDRESNHIPKEEKIVINNVELPIVRFGFKASYGEGFKNIVPFLKFQHALRLWLKSHIEEYDLVHACDFDTAYFTFRQTIRIKKKFIFDIFDFLYGDPKTLFQKIIKKAQLSIIDKADGVIICTEERRNQIKGSLPKKLVVIHNTPSIEQMPKMKAHKSNRDGRPKVCYVGILQDKRLLKEIGHYFSKNIDIEFHIGGFGLLAEYFSQLSKECDNIHYYGRISYEKTLELEANSDILLAIYDPSIENHIYAAPNKFYESLLLGKPVIMVKNTGMSKVVKEYNIGELIDYSEKGFENGIVRLLKRSNEWKDMGEREKALYSECYDWQTMEYRLSTFYKEIFDENK